MRRICLIALGFLLMPAALVVAVAIGVTVLAESAVADPRGTNAGRTP